MSPQVWLRFEKSDDGTVMKFRIQDLPETRILEDTELIAKYFVRDESIRKAIGTVAWMTHFGIQKAAARDGWETLYEVSYEEVSCKHGVRFEDVPLTIKLMVGRPHPDYPAVMSA